MRNWLPLAALYVVYSAPFETAQYFFNPNAPDLFATVNGIVHPSAHAHKATPARLGLWFDLLTLCSIGARAIVAGALVAAGNAIYEGSRLSFGAAYAAALKHARGLLSVLLAVIVIVVALFAIAAIPAMIFGVIVTVSLGSNAAGGAIGVATALVVLAIPLAIAIPVACMVGEMAMRAILLEEVSARLAISRGVKRLITRGIRRRTVVASLGLFSAYALQIIVYVVARHVLLFGTIHSQPATVAVLCIISPLFAAFLSILLTIFYFDVRVRTEAYDLTRLARVDVVT